MSVLFLSSFASIGHATTGPGAIETSVATLVTGAITVDGDPIARGNVVAIAWPNDEVLSQLKDGDPVPTRVIGSALTNDAGEFAVDVDPMAVPESYRNMDGLVDVELVVAGDPGHTRWFFSAVINNNEESTLTWHSLRADTEASNHEPTASHAAIQLDIDLGMNAHVIERGDNPSDWIDDTGQTLGAKRGLEAAKVPVDVTAADALSAEDNTLSMEELSGTWTATSNYQTNRKKAFANAIGIAQAKAVIHEVAGTNHTLDVAFKSPTASSWTQSGTISKSFAAGANDQVGSTTRWHNRVNYRQYRCACSITGTSYQWRPHGYHSLLTDPTSISRPNWAKAGHCTNYSSGTRWKSSATNATFSTGVDLTVLNVSVRSGWNNETKLSWTFTGPGRLCGSSTSGWVSSAQAGAYTR